MFINLLYFDIQYVLYNCDIYIYISLCLSLYYLTIEINDRSIHYICIYGYVCMSVGVCVSMCVCVYYPLKTGSIQDQERDLVRLY